MNDCQKEVFQPMQANNEQYLAKVKENSQQYYSAMAPITAQNVLKNKHRLFLGTSSKFLIKLNRLLQKVT